MDNLSESELIRSKPIAEGLDAFRNLFNSTCTDLGVSGSSDTVQHIGDEGLKNLTLDLILALQSLPAARLLPSPNRRGILLGDLSRLVSFLVSDDFEVKSVIPLLNKVVNKAPDEGIWGAVYVLVTESTPPPRPLPYLDQTPWLLRNTSSFVNSSEHRKYVDDVLKDELGSSLYIGIPGFYETFFGEVAGLESVAEAVFRKCQEGEIPLYEGESGWRDWPEGAKEKEVLKWFAARIDLFLNFAKEYGSTPSIRRRLLAQPDQPLQGTTAERKLDVGFVNDAEASENSKFKWSQILVPGELKSNPTADTLTRTWLDLARYAREVLTTQDTRRFILGFTLCGSTMRLWEFDRLGGIASSPFDINKNGLQFVSVVLGYLWMDEEQLGFDPTILESDGKRYIEITRNDQKERLVLDEFMKRAHSVAGRATTCWKAHRDGDEAKMPLVIKDSWQYPEREEEGEVLMEATKKGVVNVARYYCYETVRVGGKDDDIRYNVRKGLDISKATNYFRQGGKAEGSMIPPSIPEMQGSTSKGGSTSISSAGRKRSSSCTNAPSPTSKRARSSSKDGGRTTLRNRVHRRLIVRDYGKAIYKASSRAAMLAALEGNIEGHQSLRDRTGRLQGDVSIGNLMMNEDEDNPSWPSFLIDLDLAIKEKREEPSGARAKTGTKVFMAIGVLLGEKHSFMHDLESFFWVLFWICIHYSGPNKESRVVAEFEEWNYEETGKLAKLKKGMVAQEDDFIKTVEENFTPYYQPLIPWVNRLRRVVFPNDKRRVKEDDELYSQMRAVLQNAREDPQVSMEL